MYYILYEKNNANVWETVSGEDAMQLRVDELAKELNVDADEIIVFSADDEIE